MDFSKAVNIMSGANSTSYINVNNPNIIRLDTTISSKGNQPKYYDSLNILYIKEQINITA